jgi:NTE family protein
LAHIGVLDVLEESQVPIDMIVGTSVGALVGALYASGVPIQEIQKMAEEIGWNELAGISGTSFIRLFLTEKLVSADTMEDYLRRSLGDKRFDQLDIPFACVATDIRTGERILFREGPVAPAARASATIPGIFSPTRYRHRLLVDGGIVDNVPTDVAKLMGADVIIAVPVSADFSDNHISNVFLTLQQSLYIQGALLEKDRLRDAHILIEPQVGDVTAAALWRSRYAMQQGRQAARQRMQDIRKHLILQTAKRWWENGDTFPPTLETRILFQERIP